MRLINANEAVKVAEHLYEMYNLAMACADTQREINFVFKRQELFKAVKAVIEHCPTVDPVKRGEWIEDDNLETVCSCCKSTAYLDNYNSGYVLFDYCPNCGAKMDGGKQC